MSQAITNNAEVKSLDYWRLIQWLAGDAHIILHDWYEEAQEFPEQDGGDGGSNFYEWSNPRKYFAAAHEAIQRCEDLQNPPSHECDEILRYSRSWEARIWADTEVDAEKYLPEEHPSSDVLKREVQTAATLDVATELFLQHKMEQ